MGVVRLVSSKTALFALCVLLLSMILMGSYSVSSKQQPEFRSEVESMSYSVSSKQPPEFRSEVESMLSINAELDSSVDPFTTFTVLPREVAVKVGDAFAVQVSVTNVTDMYGWQVRLLFDNTILECTGVSPPHDYVFSYAYTVGDALMDYNSTEFKNPLLLEIENDGGRVLIGNSLLGTDQPNFSGSGGLCLVEFKAISSGSSNLTLFVDRTGFRTYYVDPQVKPITPAVSNGEVIVSPKD